MRIRRIVGAALVATLALGATACGGDDKAEKDETTTTKAEDSSTTLPELSDEDYAKEVEPLMSELDGAGTDLCAVLQVAYGSGPQAPPSTVEQVKITVAAQAKILRSLAATEPVEAASAPVLNATADKLEADAEQAGYTVEFFQTGVNKIFDTEEFRNAISPYQTRQAADCMPEEPTAGSSGAEGGASPTTVAG